MKTDSLRFDSGKLLGFATTLLTGIGLSEDRAGDVAEVLLEGDLFGHTTHGFALLPNYLNALSEGGMQKTGEPDVVADHGSSLLWDGRYLPGPWLVRQAILEAQRRTAKHPVVAVVIRKSHHIGCLQAYLKPVTDAGQMILLSCSDPANLAVAPFGGTQPCYSPNPIAAGIPTDGDPILIDISTSSTANALCKRLADADERLPGQWLMDANGNPVDEPKVLFNGGGGSILPLGGMDLGYKGFALGLIVEALTNALGGHGRADNISRWGASVFLQIIDPARFGGREAFQREMNALAASCRNSPAIPGGPPTRMPGENALQRREDQLKSGVWLHPDIMPSLQPWAAKLGTEMPAS